MVAYGNMLGEKQYALFQQILIPSEKPVYMPVYSLFEILSNENSFNFFQNLCYPILRRVTKEEGFCNKYLDWSCVNKCG